MHIEYFNEFIVLAEELNYHAAAKRLHVSQATLSKHISMLEDHYGTRLLDRDKTHVRLTSRGSVLLECASDIWTDFKNSEELMSRSMDQNSYLFLGGQLDNPVEFNTVSLAIQRFKQIVPGCMPQLSPCTNTSPKVLTAALQAGEVDCTFFYLDDDMAAKLEGDFQHRLVVRYPLDVIVRKTSLLAKRERLALADLNERHFVHLVGPRFSSAWKLLEKQLHAHGLVFYSMPTPAIGGFDYVTIDPGDGVFLINRVPQGCPVTQHPDCVRVPLEEGDLSLELHAIFPKEGRSNTIDVFVDTLQKTYEEAYSLA